MLFACPSALAPVLILCARKYRKEYCSNDRYDSDHNQQLYQRKGEQSGSYVYGDFLYI